MCRGWVGLEWKRSIHCQGGGSQRAEKLAEGYFILLPRQSALATSNYECRRTLQDLLRFSVTENYEDLESHINSPSDRADLLTSVKVIVFDEVFSLPKVDLEACEKLLQRLHGNQSHFGGHLVILLADEHECGPVLERRRASAILDASLKSSFFGEALFGLQPDSTSASGG